MPFQTPSTLDAVFANTMAGIEMAVTTNDFNFIDFSCFYSPNNTQTVFIKSGSSIELQLLGSMSLTNSLSRFLLLLPRNPNHQLPAYPLAWDELPNQQSQYYSPD